MFECVYVFFCFLILNFYCDVMCGEFDVFVIDFLNVRFREV